MTCLGPVDQLWVSSLEGDLCFSAIAVLKDMLYFNAHECQGFPWLRTVSFPVVWELARKMVLTVLSAPSEEIPVDRDCSVS